MQQGQPCTCQAVPYNESQRQATVRTGQRSDMLGRRVFVVEDDDMLRALLEDALAQLGYVVAATATRVEKAVEVAGSSDFDCAILDVDLDGYSVSFVADTLVARGMPFLFATGHGQAGLP